MNEAPEKVFLHVGTRKSGTTSLQQALIASEEALAAQGVHLVHPDREELRRVLVDPLRVLRDAGEEAAAREAVRELRDHLASRPAPVHLLSIETIAEMPRAVTDVLVGGLADYEVHVVITVRHWGLTIPSEWQQGVKSRLSITYADFVAAIRDRAPEAAGFLSRQDVPAIVDRWGALLSPDRVHVVACPPRSRTEGTLVDLFCGVVGIDPGSLDLGQGELNTSLSLPQAELVRRVNSLLGPERLPLHGGRYQRSVRRWVVRHAMAHQERASIRLPAAEVEWVAAETQAQLDGIRARGVDLVGDAADLLADPEAPTGPVEPSDAEVLATAVETIADLAERHLEEVERLEARIAQLKVKARGRAAKRAGKRAPGAGAAGRRKRG